MNEIVENQQDVCWFCPLGQRARRAVVWLADGRGACGAHEQALTHLPLRDLRVA